MKTKIKTPAVAVHIPLGLTPLGCAVRVTYVPATNCRPSRWKAEINDGKFTAKAFASYNYADSLEDQHKAIKACLTKWAATFETSPPTSFVLNAKGFDGSGDLYFFTLGR